MFERDLYWLALTIWMEAQGEKFEGKLAVAWVIMNRKGLSSSISDTVLRKMQFSCWNSDSNVRMNIDHAEESLAWESCYRAAAAAYFNFLPDPTRGATHYLNPSVLPKLPSWYDKTKVLVVIQNHEFLRVV